MCDKSTKIRIRRTHLAAVVFPMITIDNTKFVKKLNIINNINTIFIIRNDSQYTHSISIRLLLKNVRVLQ